jgi:hypothetical protein
VNLLSLLINANEKVDGDGCENSDVRVRVIVAPLVARSTNADRSVHTPAVNSTSSFCPGGIPLAI